MVKTLSFIFCAFIFFSSCNHKIVDLEEGGTGVIVPGKNVDDVNLGDAEGVVEAKLGKPTAKGWTDGLYRSWRSYAYWSGPHAGIHIDFMENDNNYGPVDAITVMAPYAGRTKENIGIGSLLSTVREKYGLPEHSLINKESNWIADFFCFNGKKLEVHYEDSVVSTISIGYFFPLEKDTLSHYK